MVRRRSVELVNSGQAQLLKQKTSRVTKGVSTSLVPQKHLHGVPRTKADGNVDITFGLACACCIIWSKTSRVACSVKHQWSWCALLCRVWPCWNAKSLDVLHLACLIFPNEVVTVIKFGENQFKLTFKQQSTKEGGKKGDVCLLRLLGSRQYTCPRF